MGLVSPFRLLKTIKGATLTILLRGPDSPVHHTTPHQGATYSLLQKKKKKKLSELRHKARTPHCVCAEHASSRPSTPRDARAHSKLPKPGRASPAARPPGPPVHARASLPRTTAAACPSVRRSGSPDDSRALSARLTSAATGLARLLVLARRRPSLKRAAARGRLLWRVRGWGRRRRRHHRSEGQGRG